MGRVFLGVSAGGRPVAVKVVRAELAADPEFRNRFGREVAAARRVSGMFTAMVVDADIDGPAAWLATAYVPGPSLAKAIKDHGPLPAGSLLTLAAGLAESLSAIHAAGVVHRDLKPSNVLIAQDGPRVIDFGISRAAESTQLTQAGLVIGSPGFMSPEQAAGYEVGPPSDIFSLGAVLAFAATGEGPFGTGTTAALLYRVVHGDPALDRVPSEVRPLIERCLAKDPGLRPTADGLLAEVGRPPADAGLAARLDHPRVRPRSRVRSRARHGRQGCRARRGARVAGRARVGRGARHRRRRGDADHGGRRRGAGTQRGKPAAGPRGRSADRHLEEHAAGRGPILPGARTSAPARQPPPGASPGQPPPGGSRPQRRLWRPMVLVWIIAGMIAAGIAGIAVTSFTGGSTPTPGQSPAGLTSSAATSTAGGRGAPGGSASASSSSAASRSVSSPASAAASSSQGTSQPASAPASASRVPAEPPRPEPPLVRSPSPTSASPTSKAPTPTPTTSAPTPTEHPPQHRHRRAPPRPRRRAQHHPHRYPRLGTLPQVRKAFGSSRSCRADGPGVGSEDEMAQRLTTRRTIRRRLAGGEEVRGAAGRVATAPRMP